MQVIVEGVGFSYRNRQVLDQFDARFESNRVTALVGPSGSGKSTLLAAIAGYTRPQAGHVWFADPDGQRKRPSVEQVTWIAQDANVLAARTALDNVLVGALSDGSPFSAASERALTALRDVGLAHLMNERCRTMSGGEKQRVAIARSLASDRPLIVADEPSASLDESSTRSIARLLSTIAGRATVIVATHDPVIVEAASAVVRLRGDL
ncbi:ABC transporter ATP-binding protein [Gryllotalpicola reticulitermitis]|uniref:ABC transporter ATP-binding protein n=1 Tax=Gryllotalpicola reticulitermitis TaxID=1184153 RepID=A0ABV8Q864_9MICO